MRSAVSVAVMTRSISPGRGAHDVARAGTGPTTRDQHHAIDLVPAHPRAVHVLDDADDADGLALVVVEGLAERVLAWGTARSAKPWLTMAYGRPALLHPASCSSIIVGSKVVPADSFTPSVLTPCSSVAEVVGGRVLALLVRQRVEARWSCRCPTAAPAGWARRRRCRASGAATPCRRAPWPGKSKSFSKPVTENEKMFWSSMPVGRPILLDALLREVDGIHHDGQRDRDLQGHQDGAGAIAQQRGENGSDFHGYCTLR